MKKFVFILSIAIVLGLSTFSNATLYDRGGGLIYDDDLNITWLQDPGIGGMQNWSDAIAWADSFEYAGYDDWRLPSTPEPAYVGYTNLGELGHLFCDELGNTPGETLTNAGPFILDLTKIETDMYNIYWTSTAYSSDPANYAWLYYFGYNVPGDLRYEMKIRPFGAWAVRDGDSHPVPSPATIWLLGSGLIWLVGLRRKFKK